MKVIHKAIWLIMFLVITLLICACYILGALSLIWVNMLHGIYVAFGSRRVPSSTLVLSFYQKASLLSSMLKFTSDLQIKNKDR